MDAGLIKAGSRLGVKSNQIKFPNKTPIVPVRTKVLSAALRKLEHTPEEHAAWVAANRVKRRRNALRRLLSSVASSVPGGAALQQSGVSAAANTAGSSGAAQNGDRQALQQSLRAKLASRRNGSAAQQSDENAMDTDDAPGTSAAGRYDMSSAASKVELQAAWRKGHTFRKVLEARANGTAPAADGAPPPPQGDAALAARKLQLLDAQLPARLWAQSSEQGLLGCHGETFEQLTAGLKQGSALRLFWSRLFAPADTQSAAKAPLDTGAPQRPPLDRAHADAVLKSSAAKLRPDSLGAKPAAQVRAEQALAAWLTKVPAGPQRAAAAAAVAQRAAEVLEVQSSTCAELHFPWSKLLVPRLTTETWDTQVGCFAVFIKVPRVCNGHLHCKARCELCQKLLRARYHI